MALRWAPCLTPHPMLRKLPPLGPRPGERPLPLRCPAGVPCAVPGKGGYGGNLALALGVIYRHKFLR